MKIITDSEMVKEIDEGAGWCNFMGGSESKNGKEIRINNSGIYLFLPEELDGDDYKRIMDEQTQEGQKFVEEYEERRKNRTHATYS